MGGDGSPGARAGPFGAGQTHVSQNVLDASSTTASGEFHFHSGPQFAADLLGYDLAELERLPEDTTRSFAGVGNALSVGAIEVEWARNFGVVGVNLFARKLA